MRLKTHRKSILQALGLLAIVLALVTAFAPPAIAQTANCPTGTADLNGNGSCGDPVDIFMGRRIGTGKVTIDFANKTITCEDSGAITVTGALAGSGSTTAPDTCVVTAPASSLTGAGTGVNSQFSCYVSADNTVKVRHCAVGTADNPGSGTYWVTVYRTEP